MKKERKKERVVMNMQHTAILCPHPPLLFLFCLFITIYILFVLFLVTCCLFVCLFVYCNIVCSVSVASVRGQQQLDTQYQTK